MSHGAKPIDPVVNLAQDVDSAKIAALTFQNAGNPLTFVEGATNNVRNAYGRLKTEAARKAFWDSFEFSMESRAPAGWAQIYEALELLRLEEWYWRPKYQTFDDYLRHELVFSFRQLDALEEHYQFAMIAHPQLFSTDRQKTARAILSRRKVEAETAAAAHAAPIGSAMGRPRKESRVPHNGEHDFSPAAEVDLAAQSPEFRRGLESRGSTNRFHRFRVLKTHAPKFAQRVLDGRYTKQRANGTYFVDLGQAEQDAEKAHPDRFKKFRRKSRAKSAVEKALEAINKLTPAEFTELANEIRPRLCARPSTDHG